MKERITISLFTLMAFMCHAQVIPSYGDLHRIESVEADKATLTYSYDAVGNRLTKQVNLEGVIVQAKVFLQAAYVVPSTEMKTILREKDLIPTAEPYTGLSYSHVGGGGESLHPVVFRSSSSDAIVDWLVLGIRDKDDPTSQSSGCYGDFSHTANIL